MGNSSELIADNKAFNNAKRSSSTKANLTHHRLGSFIRNGVLGLVGMWTLGATAAWPQATPTPAPNPDWVVGCKNLDIAVIIDFSGSISGPSLDPLNPLEYDDLLSSLDGFLGVYSEGGNYLVTAGYSTEGFMWDGYTEITPTYRDDYITRLETRPTASRTNWESGFRALLHYLDGESTTTYAQQPAGVPAVAQLDTARVPDLLLACPIEVVQPEC